MRTNAILLILFILLTGCSAKDANELETRASNNLTYVKGTNRIYDGSVIAYYPDTGSEKKVYQEGSYRMGLKDGVWTTYKWNGDKETATYRFGKLNGPLILTARNGNKLKEENYVNNLLDGLSTAWDYKGELVYQQHFKEGNPIPAVLERDPNDKKEDNAPSATWDQLKNSFRSGFF